MLSRDAGPRNGYHGPRPERAEATLGQRLLRVPLFWKLLLAHLVVVTAVVLVTLWLATRFATDPPSWSVAAVTVLAWVTLSTMVTAVVLRHALAPLDDLEEAAARALAGDDTEARISVHPAADDELRTVVTLFNELLEHASEHRRRLGELTARALDTVEAERRHVGLLLQDEVAQRLASLLVQLRLLERADDPESRKRSHERLREAMVETLEGVRRTARALRPPELEELGLDRAVVALVREAGEYSSSELSAEVEPVHGSLSRPSALALFRILQEALLAARRAEPPCRIEVRVYRSDGSVVGEVATEGRSPELEAWLRDRGGCASNLRLFGIRERARFLGGEVSIERGADGITRVQATVPVERG